jgi:hypothetical protein
VSPAPTGHTKPQNDAEYQALPGYTEFEGNCTSIGVTPAEALGFWKGVMDQLFANQDEANRLKDNKAALLAYVDSAGQRAGYTAMAEAMLRKFPLDVKDKYGLWSGKNAELYAQLQGVKILEGTQLGSIFNGVTTAFSKNWTVMQGLWRAISDAYAREIATIMRGQQIEVFVRKQGDIFAGVESGAIKEVQEKVGATPTYTFHAIGCEGTFSNESPYDGTPNNADARSELTKLAGTADKAKAAAETDDIKLNIFKWGDGPVPAAELKDVGQLSGPSTQVGAAVALLNPMNAATAGKVDQVKSKLSTKSKGP